MKRRMILLSALLLICFGVFAQQRSEAYLEASEAFELGQFERVETILNDKVSDMPVEDQVQSYRLLALSCLYRDMNEQAEKYALNILLIDPFYSTYGETPRFVELLNKVKKSSSTMTTASKMAETVEEVPVPVTLITSDMIKASGATKLQDVLLLYVPGMSQIGSLEDNVAMRGVYGLGQETILVLLDGHRLNSSATNSESFDFRNSLEKVKQIEVLRGPASCLYGNFALTAVVNIITKSGAQLDGGEVSVMGGSNKSYGGTIMFGNGNLKYDYSAWVSIYNSEGQPLSLSKTTHYIGGYNEKPTYDLGARVRWGDLKLEVTAQQGHPVPYYNIFQVGDKFSYDDYGTINGNKPGMSRSNIRADVEWDHTWKNFSLSASAYVSTERQQMYNVISDTVDYHMIEALAKVFDIPSFKTSGVRQSMEWEDYGLGLNVSGAYEYKIGKEMHGSVMLGIQYENLLLGDSQMLVGADFDKTNYVQHGILTRGAEHNLSVLAQIKHYFSDKFIFNGGVRIDNKIRIGGDVFGTVSPRVSLIWLPTGYLTVKGGYSHSFVDAAPLYRLSQISLFSGGPDLNPEKMDSFQASMNFNWKHIGLNYEMNLFYNVVSDMVYYNLGGVGTTFSNSGHIAMGGMENVLQYKNERFFVNFNCTYQYPFSILNYYNTNDPHSLTNVPKLLGNLVAQYAIASLKKGDKVWIRANIHSQGPFNCLYNNLEEKMKDPSAIYTYRQDGYAVVGGGIEWDSHFGLDCSLEISNIGDRKYDIGGQLYKGVPGLGRGVMLKIDYHF